jgi:FixJ family two-component response regulator
MSCVQQRRLAGTNNCLAVARNTHAAVVRIKRAESIMPTPRKTIAIVEDDDSVRVAMARQLRLAGYTCRAYACADEFLTATHDAPADCLVTDIQLGGMTGLQLAMHPAVTGKNLPVILITGTCDPLLEIPAREIGAAFLRKPIRAEVLLEALIDIVGPPICDGDD